MATNRAIKEAELDALARKFTSTVGAHLGVVKYRPMRVVRPELYEVIKKGFEELEKGGWFYNDLDELINEAQRLKRLLQYPNELTKGRTPPSQKQSLERNLLSSPCTFHPAIGTRVMPRTSIVIDEQGRKKIVGELPENTVKLVDSFTLNDLITYWNDKVGGSREDNVKGSFVYLLERYPFVDILYSIDSLATDLDNVRDKEYRKSYSPFDLTDYLKTRSKEREELNRW